MPFRPLGQPASQPAPRPLMPGGTLGGLRLVNPQDRAAELRQEEAIKAGSSVGEYKAKKTFDMQMKSQEPMSGDAAKTFQLPIDGILNLEQIRKKVEGGSNMVLPEYFDRDLAGLTTDLTDVLGRLRSGGAIGDKEFESFSKMIPSWRDPQAVKVNKINRLEAKFRNLAGQMAPKDRLEAALTEGRKLYEASAQWEQPSPKSSESQPSSFGIYEGVDDDGTVKRLRARTAEEAKKLESLGAKRVQ